ncbi:hypothetical protein RCC89_11980 [Cytophagaceae bacterium ABcell3]|nr:hypothetical protein RCC89_11980 [Cytophagaceae bacterium ABcell3]
MKIFPFLVLIFFVVSCNKEKIDPSESNDDSGEEMQMDDPLEEEYPKDSVDFEYPNEEEEADSLDMPDLSNFQRFLIGKGSHSSVSVVRFFTGNEMNFNAVFDESAIYDLASSNQSDINKLYGFSDCGNFHHTNSARFGWRWYQEELQIFAYCYSNGQRNMEYITSVDLGKEYQYSIKKDRGQYIFSVNNQSTTMDRGCSGNGRSYYLFPYFGGTETAPHDITIHIQEI